MTNQHRSNGNPTPRSSALGLVIVAAAIVVLSADVASAETTPDPRNLWRSLLSSRWRKNQRQQPTPHLNRLTRVTLTPTNLQQRPTRAKVQRGDEDVGEFEYEDFPTMPEFLRQTSPYSATSHQYEGRSYKPLGRKRYLGMDIPDYIAASGANSGAISSMSSKMKSMGRKKRILGMEIPGYIANSGAGISTIKSMSKKMKTMGRRKRLLGMDIPDYIASSGAEKGMIKSMSDKMKSMG